MGRGLDFRCPAAHGHPCILQPPCGGVIGACDGGSGESVGVVRVMDSFSLFRCCWRLVCERKC